MKYLKGRRWPILAATISGFDLAEVEAAYFQAKGRNVSNAGLILPALSWGENGRICPTCLREDYETREGPEELRPYRRDWWHFAYITTCPIHACHFISTCPGCARPLESRRLRADRCTCGFRLVQSPVVDAEDSSGDAYLLGRLGRSRKIHSEILDELSIQSAAGLMFAAGASFCTEFDLKRGGWQFQKRARRLSNAGFHVLDGGWDKFSETLDALRAARTSRKRSWYGVVESWLMQHQSPELDELKNVMLAHARARPPLSSKTELLRQPLGVPGRITMRAASKQVGQSSGTLRRGLKLLGIYDHSLGGHERDTISPQTLARLQDLFHDALSASEAAAFLGVLPVQLNHWTKGGLLTPILPPEHARGRKLYRRSDLQAFSAAIARAAPFVHTIGRDQITLSLAAHWPNPVDVLRAILKREIIPVGRLESTNPLDLGQVIVAKSDIRRLEARKLDGLSVVRMTDLLGISADALRVLLPSSHSKRGIRILSFEEIVSLDAAYLALSRISQLTNLSWYKVMRRLRLAELPRAFEVGTVVYRRADVEKIFGPLPMLSLEDLRRR